MYKLPMTEVKSPEDESVMYLDFPDGLRLVFRDGQYSGWYPVQMTEGNHYEL